MGKLAKTKVWIAIGGKLLVPDGDESAEVLLATPGLPVSDEELAKYENSDEFFEEPAKVEEKPAEKPAEKKHALREDDDDLDEHKRSHHKK